MGLFFPDPLKDATEKSVITSDGVKIAFNHYERGHDSIVILVHGWFMCKDSACFRSLCSKLAETYDVAAMDCRGHGRSGGSYSFSTHEEKDVIAVVNHLRPQYKKMYLMGFSMGGALVILHAAKLKNIDKVIAVSAPSDFKKVENRFYKPEAWIPTFQKGELWRAFSIRVGRILGKKPAAIDFVKDVQCPLMFLCGGKDPTVYPWHAQALHDAATCAKAIEVFEHSEHAEDLWRNEPIRFLKIVRGWLND